VSSSAYAREVSNWTAQLPDHERQDLVEAVCRMVGTWSDTNDIEPIIRLIEGWRATAEIHAGPTLAALLEVEHAGPPVPVARPAVP
jgi:hypothetical protein